MNTHGTNRGKDFEAQIRDALIRVPHTTVDRLPDQMTGYKGSTNICDFIAYHYPHQYYLECKCCYGNTLHFSNITETQWSGLLDRAEFPSVVAGYFIWFIDHDITLFVSAKTMKRLRDAGDKSFNINTTLKKLNGDYYIVPGTKKRVLFEYDLRGFLGE